ncbi:MAG: hypothetical protein JWO67_6263, partial [Streptosporangiaceae bacterium]|nr:hypothetical protein [Streptosporangiaceae bacterium]
MGRSEIEGDFKDNGHFPEAVGPSGATRFRHRGQRASWLRAAVLGADDGIVSVASVLIGVIAANASR